MEHHDYVAHARAEYQALRAIVLSVGPDVPVPTCPGWTVRKLVDHMAGVHSWALNALRTPADGTRPKATPRPQDWDDLLTFWDDRFGDLERLLSDLDPATPTWTFVGPRSAGFWARRQAHEIAIHRLDAEHAVHGHEVPTLLWDTDFAADGIDEYLTRLLVRAAEVHPIERAGRLLFHAADAGRTWELRIAPGQVPETGPPTDSGTDEDTTVAGTADAVYRSVWGRPSGAIVSGDRSLLDSLPRP